MMIKHNIYLFIYFYEGKGLSRQKYPLRSQEIQKTIDRYHFLDGVMRISHGLFLNAFRILISLRLFFPFNIIKE